MRSTSIFSTGGCHDTVFHQRYCQAIRRESKHGSTLGGHQRFALESAPSGSGRKHIGYARVSSHDQKEDLKRQVQRLKSAGCGEVLTDIGSGLNCTKPGLKQLFNRILKEQVHTLAVACEDRLLRFDTAVIRFCGA